MLHDATQAIAVRRDQDALALADLRERDETMVSDIWWLRPQLWYEGETPSVSSRQASPCSNKVATVDPRDWSGLFFAGV